MKSEESYAEISIASDSSKLKVALLKDFEAIRTSIKERSYVEIGPRKTILLESVSAFYLHPDGVPKLKKEN
jgi:hypothetical protein